MIQKDTAGTTNTTAPEPLGRGDALHQRRSRGTSRPTPHGQHPRACPPRAAPPSAGEDALPDRHPSIHPTRTGSPDSKFQQRSHSVSSPLSKSLKSEGLNLNSHTHTHNSYTRAHTHTLHTHAPTQIHNSYIHACADTCTHDTQLIHTHVQRHTRLIHIRMHTTQRQPEYINVLLSSQNSSSV